MNGVPNKPKIKRNRVEGGKSFYEISKIMNSNPMTIKNIHDRAMRKIKMLISDKEDDYYCYLFHDDGSN